MNITFKILLFTLLAVVSLDAKIIEVKQLFNKTLTKVKEENISINKSFYGNTKIDEGNIIDIVNRFDGYILKLNANKSYMKISKGEKLFSIYSDEILAIQKEIQIAKRVNEKLYQSSLEKLNALGLDKKTISLIKNSNESLKSLDINSPSNAILLEKSINEGSFAKKGNLLIRLANIDKLWFLADVYQEDLQFLNKNMSAKIYLDGLDMAIKTKIDYIYPFIDEKSKTFKVRFIVENESLNYFPNMFGKVKIAEDKKLIKTLPTTAVLNKAKKYYVFKPVSADEFEPVEVEVNRISSSKYEIISGLEVGDEVINNTLFLLDSDAITNALYDEQDNDW